MSQRTAFEFSRKIRLAPAVGDWTTIQYRDDDMEEINISKVRNINFDSLPKEQLSYVHYLHYRLAEKMTKKFSKDMDIKVELHAIVATQVAYEDFLNAQTENVVQADFVFNKDDRINVLFEWPLAQMIVDRLVGGKGETDTEKDDFNDIEVGILRTQLSEVVPFFINGWKGIYTPDDMKMMFTCGPYVKDNKITPREAYIMFTFYFNFGKAELKKVVFAYPNHVLRKFLTLRKSFADPIKRRVFMYPTTTEEINIPVKVNLGGAKLTMSELKGLKIGDIIPLDSKLDEPLEVQFGKKTSMLAQPGIIDNTICVQLILDEAKLESQKPLPNLPIPEFVSKQEESRDGSEANIQENHRIVAKEEAYSAVPIPVPVDETMSANAIPIPTPPVEEAPVVAQAPIPIPQEENTVENYDDEMDDFGGVVAENESQDDVDNYQGDFPQETYEEGYADDTMVNPQPMPRTAGAGDNDTEFAFDDDAGNLDDEDDDDDFSWDDLDAD